MEVRLPCSVCFLQRVWEKSYLLGREVALGISYHTLRVFYAIVIVLLVSPQ